MFMTVQQHGNLCSLKPWWCLALQSQKNRLHSIISLSGIIICQYEKQRPVSLLPAALSPVSDKLYSKLS